MYFDSHAHVNFAAYDADRAQTIGRALSAGVWFANIGTSLETSQQAVDLARSQPQGVFAVIGLHPGHTWQKMQDDSEHPASRQQAFDPAAFQALLGERVVGVGEIGLDYFRLPPDPAARTAAMDLQKQAFAAQLHFAQEHNLPVIIHCRDAYDDVLKILDAEYQGPGIIHSFTDTWDRAKLFLDRGFHIGLNAILAFDKSGRLAEVCRNLPSDKLVTETDAPYLAPAPYRGQRNEPLYVQEVVKTAAALRGVAVEGLADQTFNNALDVYQIKKPGQ